MKQSRNERMLLFGNHFERMFRILDTAEERGDRVEEVCNLLGNCYPSGDYRDEVGGTARQLAYIVHLARFNQTEHHDFLEVVVPSGLSLRQCGYLIDSLK